MNPDPRWLEILKASGWQTTALTVACIVFLYLSHIGTLPKLPGWALLVVSLMTLVCGCLAAASWCSAVYKIFPLHTYFLHWLNIYREKNELRKYIPFMTPRIGEIVPLAMTKQVFTQWWKDSEL